MTPIIVIRWCQKRGLSCYYFALHQLHTKSLVDSHAKAIAFSLFDNHCYLYESARWCSHMEPKPLRPPRPNILHCSVTKPPVTFDGLFEGIRQGKWYSHSIDYERRNLLSSGISPRVFLDHKGVEIRRLAIKCPQGDCTITAVDYENMTAIKAFMDHIKITYVGQSMPAAIQSVLWKLLEPKREHLTEKRRRDLRSVQNNECEKCHSPLAKGEADHICPLRDALASQKQPFRLLCEVCHREVTGSTMRRPTNPIISVFNTESYESFVISPRPVQFVMPIGKIDPQLELVNVDVKRCRRSCLLESTEGWPVFCAHDEIRDVRTICSHHRDREAESNDKCLSYRLFDFNWIDTGMIKTAKRKLTSLPYQGPRWYSRQATQWLLMRGIITWDDIKLGFEATTHLPADTFKEWR
ncbi:hypothetical protein N9L68_08580 [bacterium]|nr:hypothetical protein [bacterium]